MDEVDVAEIALLADTDFYGPPNHLFIMGERHHVIMAKQRVRELLQDFQTEQELLRPGIRVDQFPESDPE